MRLVSNDISTVSDDFLLLLLMPPILLRSNCQYLVSHSWFPFDIPLYLWLLVTPPATQAPKACPGEYCQELSKEPQLQIPLIGRNNGGTRENGDSIQEKLGIFLGFIADLW